MKILFKYATRARPNWFQETIQTYLSMLSGMHQYEFVITCDTDDATMNNKKMISFMKKHSLYYYFGNHKTKIEAINADMKGRKFDLLIVVSDDMIPVVQRYDDIIAGHLEEFFPDTDGALHYNDGSHCGAKIISLSIMGKKLYDRFGYIYWHEYQSLWCDNEFTDIVRQLGKVQYIPEIVIKHYWMKKGRDVLYNRNEELYKIDRAVFERRGALGFPNALQSNELQLTLKSYVKEKEICIHKKTMK